MALNLVVDTLAVSRLTRLVTEDAITEPFRDFVVSRYQDSKLSYLITCSACSSVWASAFVTAGVLTAPKLSRPILRMLAMSEATILLKGLVDG